jgi:hypothetical protein
MIYEHYFSLLVLPVGALALTILFVLIKYIWKQEETVWNHFTIQTWLPPGPEGFLISPKRFCQRQWARRQWKSILSMISVWIWDLGIPGQRCPPGVTLPGLGLCLAWPWQVNTGEGKRKFLNGQLDLSVLGIPLNRRGRKGREMEHHRHLVFSLANSAYGEEEQANACSIIGTGPVVFP